MLWQMALATASAATRAATVRIVLVLVSHTTSVCRIVLPWRHGGLPVRATAWCGVFWGCPASASVVSVSRLAASVHCFTDRFDMLRETASDCGGVCAACPREGVPTGTTCTVKKCASGQTCSVATDCASGFCIAGAPKRCL
jgi:hypothetical protein